MRSRGPLLVSLVLIGGSLGSGAVLSAPDQAAAPGQTVVAALSFSAEGQPVAGIQFDLEWDQALQIHIAAGVQVGTSSKIFYSASPAPQSVRCLIIGLNQNQLLDGELLRLFISPGQDASSGTAQVRLHNIVATTPDGRPVPVRAAPIAVQIQNGSPGHPLQAEAVLNAASLRSGPVAPGEIITVLGNVGTSAIVRFNGVQAPVLLADGSLVNAIVPFGLETSGPATLDVRGAGLPAVQVTLTVAAVSPAIFTQNASGTGPGAILNQDYTVNSFANPAARGSVVMLYGTGFGTLDPPAADGELAGAAAQTRLRVTANIGGVPAEVTYAGAAPGLVAGVVQINVWIPESLQPNAAVPVSLSVASVVTPVGVTISIR